MILENVKMYLVLSKMFFHNVFSHSLLIVLQIAKKIVLIMACILDMDELKMFNSLENDQLYVVGTIIQFWIVLRMLWCQRKFCRLKVLLMMNIKLKKKHFGWVHTTHHQSKFLGYTSSCIKFIGFLMLNDSNVKVDMQTT